MRVMICRKNRISNGKMNICGFANAQGGKNPYMILTHGIMIEIKANVDRNGNKINYDEKLPRKNLSYGAIGRVKLFL